MRRALVVDDDHEALRALARLVGAEGFLVDMAHSGAEARKLAESHDYAIVLIDLYLQEETGLQTIAAIQPLQPLAVFLMVTGASSFALPDDDPSAARIAQILLKPWEPTELKAALDRALALHFHQMQQTWQKSPLPRDKLQLLVIEDNPDDLRTLRMMLRRSPDQVFEIEHARTVAEALHSLRRAKPDIIVVDLSLPDARGLTAVSMLQAAARGAPVVVLSGEQDDELAFQAIRGGAQDFLLKSRMDEVTLVRGLRFALQRQHVMNEYSQLAHHHPLTGLPNRSLLRDRLQHVTQRAMRAQTTFAVLYIDLDGFKQVNDQLGHHAGDLLLIQVASRLTNTARSSDTVSHLGGDEFVIIAEQSGEPAAAETLAERVVETIEAPFDLGKHTARISASVGIALYQGAESVDALLESADQAMYRAKRAGKGRHCLGAQTLEA